MAKILLVEDEKNLRKTLSLMLRDAGYEVKEAADGASAQKAISDSDFDIVITDLVLGSVDGFEVLRYSKENSPLTEIIVVTAFGTVETAVEAIKAGAYDYIRKPISSDELLIKISKAVERRWLSGEISLMAAEFREKYHFENIVGRSQSMREVISRVMRFAPTDSTVLITGESGTGKELVARAIHANSLRLKRPFIPINCAAIPAELLESELFGHIRGSFTGAVATRKGLFEEANGGTFFFDEIAETSMSFQVKILRVIQDHEVRKVGDNKAVKVDARIIAATNQELVRAIFDKRFRQDLFYRLNVGRIHIAPLRERKEDIPVLVEHFLTRFQKKFNKPCHLDKGVLKELLSYDYPGNVRELENLMEQAVVLAVSEVIRSEDVQVPRSSEDKKQPTLKEKTGELERVMIQSTLEKTTNLQEAAKILGLSSTTLWRKIKKYSIKMKRALVVEEKEKK
ncbi:MAG: sigma-54 dependent transcriptional regulator [Pseudomonadota bacterium]